MGGFFDTFWYGTEDSEESGPETEISGRDLDFGRGVEGMSYRDMLEEMRQRLKRDFWNCPVDGR